MSCRLNGTEYESDEKIDSSVFTSDNLSDITIDGENIGKMVLHSAYDFGFGTRFTLRKQTEQELLQERIEAANTEMQLALAEVYELVLDSMV